MLLETSGHKAMRESSVPVAGGIQKPDAFMLSGELLPEILPLTLPSSVAAV